MSQNKKNEVLFTSDRVTMNSDGSFTIHSLPSNRTALQLFTFLGDEKGMEYAFRKADFNETIDTKDGQLGVFQPIEHVALVRFMMKEMQTTHQGWSIILAIGIMREAMNVLLAEIQEKLKFRPSIFMEELNTILQMTKFHTASVKEKYPDFGLILTEAIERMEQKFQSGEMEVVD